MIIDFWEACAIGARHAIVGVELIKNAVFWVVMLCNFVEVRSSEKSVDFY
jgi:hypothetical protein